MLFSIPGKSLLVLALSAPIIRLFYLFVSDLNYSLQGALKFPLRRCQTPLLPLGEGSGNAFSITMPKGLKGFTAPGFSATIISYIHQIMLPAAWCVLFPNDGRSKECMT
jgi:hypothetical protein